MLEKVRINKREKINYIRIIDSSYLIFTIHYSIYSKSLNIIFIYLKSCIIEFGPRLHYPRVTGTLPRVQYCSKSVVKFELNGSEAIKQTYDLYVYLHCNQVMSLTKCNWSNFMVRVYFICQFYLYVIIAQLINTTHLITQTYLNFTFHLKLHLSFLTFRFLSFSSRPYHYLPKAQCLNLIMIVYKILNGKIPKTE